MNVKWLRQYHSEVMKMAQTAAGEIQNTTVEAKIDH